MANTNFSLAPPPKTVDGLAAVPIDIQKITATLTFDGALSTGSGDATVEFTMGPQNGNPIFDLRQTITDAWLDGAALPVTQLAHHDFGGGPDADLRIVESALTAGTAHALRVKYALGPPQASGAGSYQPAMTFSVGPRVAFNFGFTDLGAGRYLEAWIPANLIFDQFELVLTLQVLNTLIPHTVITNGAVTALGSNHWSVAFPARFTALSTLLEVRASDTLAGLTDTTTLPVSGTNVTIETWKLSASPINLATEINNLKMYLAEDENFNGKYIHGSRFVAFLNVGGMEYEGGTTSSSGPLRHETFHSWWARGVLPASQPDGWWDEAWTVYHDNGAAGSLPFDFTSQAVTLHPANPWVRITASGAYADGERFFRGVAALIGIANLKSYMSEFYNARLSRPVTTMDLEEHLVCRSGEAQLVDAFHRFVYGFPSPSPVPDLWLKDDPGHTGAEFWAGNFWNSPDLWIRNADDGGASHQPPEYGQDNWFYARVRNRSATATARHFLVSFNVKAYAGTEFVYPGDFLPCIAAVAGFELGPGESRIVKARWPKALVPPPGTHACWLAAVLSRSDQPIAGRHVWEHNNLAQKNLTIVNLAPDRWFILPVLVSNLKATAARRFVLELVRPADRVSLQAALIHDAAGPLKLVPGVQPFPMPPLDATVAKAPRLDCSGAETGPGVSRGSGILTSDAPSEAVAFLGFPNTVEAPFPAGVTSRIPVSLRAAEQAVFGLKLRVPPEAKAGEILRLNLVKRDATGKHVLGGVAVEIRVTKV